MWERGSGREEGSEWGSERREGGGRECGSETEWERREGGGEREGGRGRVVRGRGEWGREVRAYLYGDVVERVGRVDGEGYEDDVGF